MSVPATCRAAVFTGPHEPLELREFPVPNELPAGSALCRVLLSTICGSDLHTTQGRRIEPAPSILGHESVGEVVALGPDACTGDGEPLREGDRVTWTIMAACGRCFYCHHALPQKCEHLLKYGHTATGIWPGLNGGYGEYVYLYPGTAVYRVPETLPDAVAAPANCALATVVCGLDAIGGVGEGDNVLIAGAGLLGTYLAALARDAGAGRVLVADANPKRAAQARRFGAHATFADSTAPERVSSWARSECDGPGVDVAFEVCGHPEGALSGLEALRTGGRLLVAGLVTPDSRLELDGNQITRRCLTIRGIHNYAPIHLKNGLAFLERTRGDFPYGELVSPPFALDDINSAFRESARGTWARVSVSLSD